MKNVELKVKLDDRAEMLRRVRRLGTKRVGALRQRDTYFRVPRGRLKLREERSVGAELIFYERANTDASRSCDYEIVRMSAKEGVALTALFANVLGTRIVVKKVRTLFLYRHTRIHIDQVEGLGDFLELETVIRKQSLPAARAEHQEIIAALGLDGLSAIGGSYSDLLLEKKKTW